MSTIRLPPPPPPPKPLHLTMSLRDKQHTYPMLPDWSQQGADEGWSTIREGGRSGAENLVDGEDEPEDEWDTAKTSRESSATGVMSLESLFKEVRSIGDEPSYGRKVPLLERGGSGKGSEFLRGTGSRRFDRESLKRRKVGDRNSIFFDPALVNPFVPPAGSPYSTLQPIKDSTSTTPSSNLQDLFSDHRNPTEFLEPPVLPAETIQPDEENLDLEDDDNILELPSCPLPALALHPFSGEVEFGELTFKRGDDLCIEVEDIGGGWSLGYLKHMGEDGRGLVPIGWYAYIEVEENLAPKVPSHNPPPLPTVTSLDAREVSVATESNGSKSSSPTSVFESPTKTDTAEVVLASDLEVGDVARSRTPVNLPEGAEISFEAPIPETQHQVSPPKFPTLTTPPGSPGLTPPSSTLRNRSIGRKIVISGIEFEPTDFLIESPSTSSPVSETNSVPDASTISPEKKLVLTKQDMDGFFGVLREPIVGEKEQEFTLAEFMVKTRVDNPVTTSEELIGPSTVLARDEDASPASREVYQISEQQSEDDRDLKYGVLKDDGDCDVVEWTTSVLLSVAEDSEGEERVSQEIEASDSSEEDQEDTQITREARWAAVIEAANELSKSENAVAEPEEEFSTVSDESNISSSDTVPPRFNELLSADKLKPSTSSTAFLILLKDQTSSSPDVDASSTSAIPHPARDSIFSRFGFSTLSRSYSSASVGLGRSNSGSRIISSTAAVGLRGRGIVLDWIENGGTTLVETEVGRLNTTTYNIEHGPAWNSDSPPFTVYVHSPKRQTIVGTTSEFTSYEVTTVFSSLEEESVSVTVERRYSHFVALKSVLVDRFGILTIPELPPKRYTGSLLSSFIEGRRRDLERWLHRVGRHDVLRSTEEIRGFLAIESEDELELLLRGVSLDQASFFGKVYHPEYNIHHSDAEDLVHRFESYGKALEATGILSEVESDFGAVRGKMLESANSLKTFARGLGQLVAGTRLPSSSAEERAHEEFQAANQVEGDRLRAVKLCLQTEEGAFTWKESCEDALSTTKAVQATAESIFAVGNLVEDHARNTTLPVQELLRELAYPLSQHLSLIATHRSSLKEHERLSQTSLISETSEQEEKLERCDTILNITCAELARIHKERLEDTKRVVEEYLRGQIELHEQSLAHLRFAQSHFGPGAFASLAQTGPRLRSFLQQPETATLASALTLTSPSDYGVPSAVKPIGEILTTTVRQVLSSSSNPTAPALGRSNSTAMIRSAPTSGTIGRAQERENIL